MDIFFYVFSLLSCFKGEWVVDVYAIEREICTPRASYRLEFGLNFMPHPKRTMRHLFI